MDIRDVNQIRNIIIWGQNKFSKMKTLTKQAAAATDNQLAATTARSEVSSPSAAICLFLIPVRSKIQVSVVSTIFSKSELVMIFCGKYEPVAIILL